MTVRQLALLALLSVLLITLSTPSQLQAVAQLTEPDYWPTTDWQTASPESQGMDSSWLVRMESYINEAFISNPLRSILVVRHGYLVYENYFGNPEMENQTNNIYSCTKSVTSSLVGIAVSQGYLDIDEYLVDFFPNMTIENLDSRKQAITVEHLLTMTSGLPWDEWSYPYGSPLNDWDRMTGSPNWVEFVINRPMDYVPGEQWVYNTGGSHLLSAVLTQATNLSALSFAETHLFGPLGITDYAWNDDPQGNHNGGSALRLRARDMAKFGFLYLHNGTWDGEEILPASWVTASSAHHATVDSQTQYGYQWWIHPSIDAYAAHGHQNQHIFVFPHLDMIVVFTARSTYLDVFLFLEDYIILAAMPPMMDPLLLTGLLVIGSLVGVFVIVSSVVSWRKKNQP
ncbi:MAG: serine hydrolase domain-containing protein [Promethearchaeota archaeon]